MVAYHHVVLPAVPWGPHSADEQRLGLSAGYPRMVHSCFPACPLGAEYDCHGYGEHSAGEQGGVVLKWYPSPTFGLLATKAASVIPPPALGARSTARGPRLSLLVPVSPRYLLVHVVGQVPHDAHAVLHRLWGEESWWGMARWVRGMLTLSEKTGHSQVCTEGTRGCRDMEV